MHEHTLMVYVSAHGFGHWAQVAPVLQHLHDRLPELRLVIRTALPDSLLRQSISFPFIHLPGEMDIGVIQLDAMHEDIEATRQAVSAFHQHWQSHVEEEARLLHHYEAALVLSDIAPLGFAAAREAGIPSVGLCTLDWHDIYAPLFGIDFPPLEDIRTAHMNCTLLLKPPLCMPMQTFPRYKDIGLISRRSEADANATRTQLGLLPEKNTALIAFGGAGIPDFEVQALGEIPGWQFILPGQLFDEDRLPGNVVPSDLHLYAMVDLLAAADCVVCKPGYGMLAEAWTAGKPVAYVPRSAFPEYPFLKEWLDTQAPSQVFELPDFRRGNWLDTLQNLMTLQKTYPPLPADGAIEAASLIAHMI